MTQAANVALALDPAEWLTVNDDVMGGASTACVRATGSGLRFEGTLSLDAGGGFASARQACVLPAGLASASVRGIGLKVLGDGKRYRLTVFTRSRSTSQREPYHYQARFETTGDDQQLGLSLADFVASFRGRPVAAPPLDLACMVAVGLQISDRQEGPFALELRAIELRGAPGHP